MIYTVENIDGIVKEFTTDEDFINYAQTIFIENEEPGTFLHLHPTSVETAEHYIKTYCDNLELEIS